MIPNMEMMRIITPSSGGYEKTNSGKSVILLQTPLIEIKQKLIIHLFIIYLIFSEQVYCSTLDISSFRVESRSPPRMPPPVPCQSACCSHIVTYDQHFNRHEWQEYVQESDRHRQRDRGRETERQIEIVSCDKLYRLFNL